MLIELQLTGNKIYVDLKLQHLINDKFSFRIPCVVCGMRLVLEAQSHSELPLGYFKIICFSFQDSG